jgi:endoglucanase
MGEVLMDTRLASWRWLWIALWLALWCAMGGQGLAEDASVAGVNMRLLPHLDRVGATPLPELLRFNDARLELARKSGFNFVRIGVPGDAWITHPSPAEQARILALLRGLLRSAASTALAVEVALFIPAREIVCEHRYGDRYRAALTAIVTELPDRRDVGIEVVNEPPSCGNSTVRAEPWEEMQQQLYHEVRSLRQQVLFVAAGPGWGGVDGLLQLDPGPFRDDPNTAFTFHYYEPFLFTHQQVGWLRPDHLSQFVSGLAWPVERANLGKIRDNALSGLAGETTPGRDRRPEDQNTLRQLFVEYQTQGTTGYLTSRFQAVADWAAAHRLPGNRISLGEFGVHRPVSAAGTAGEPWPTAPAWLAAVRSEAERRTMGWVVWDLDSGFAVVCGDRDRPGAGELCPAYRTVFAKQP